MGSGLQVGASVSLGTSTHGGKTVHVASANPAVLLVSPDATTPGTAFDRRSGARRDRLVQLLRAGSGAGGRHGHHHRLGAGAHHRLSGCRRCRPRPTRSRGSTPAPTPLRPTIRSTSRWGCPTAAIPSLYTVQNVRAGAPGPLTVTLTSGTPAVGTLVTSAGSGATRARPDPESACTTRPRPWPPGAWRSTSCWAAPPT